MQYNEPIGVTNLATPFGFGVCFHTSMNGFGYTALVDCIFTVDAAQALLPNTHQHGAAEVAVSGLLEVLQGPGMPPIALGARVIHSQEDQQRDGGHSPVDPLL